MMPPSMDWVHSLAMLGDGLTPGLHQARERMSLQMTTGNGMPAISVIVPTFNAAETVLDQLNALANQSSVTPFEVIVCDNGSTDDTLRVVQDFAATVDWLRVIDASQRKGAGAARNAGAKGAAAPLLAFCDADDVVSSGWVASMVEELERTDLAAGLVDADLLTTRGAASVSWHTQPPIRVPFWPEFGAGATNNLAIRASVFRDIGGFDEELLTGEDIDLCWRAQCAGHSFSICESAVVAIRKREGRRAVFRQAVAYGKGEKLLRRKHGHRAREYRLEVVPPLTQDESPVAPRTVRTRIGHAALVIRRLRTAQQQADILWRSGYWFGLKSRPPSREGSV